MLSGWLERHAGSVKVIPVARFAPGSTRNILHHSLNKPIVEFVDNQKKSIIFASLEGALAQLARASRWQCEGHRFDSDMLHLK